MRNNYFRRIAAAAGLLLCTAAGMAAPDSGGQVDVSGFTATWPLNKGFDNTTAATTSVEGLMSVAEFSYGDGLVMQGTRTDGGISETITVRRISYGVGCEKVFPVHSPSIVSVTTVRKGKVRRAKLYYLRDRVGKKAKVKERI